MVIAIQAKQGVLDALSRRVRAPSCSSRRSACSVAATAHGKSSTFEKNACATSVRSSAAQSASTNRLPRGRRQKILEGPAGDSARASSAAAAAPRQRTTLHADQQGACAVGAAQHLRAEGRGPAAFLKSSFWVWIMIVVCLGSLRTSKKGLGCE